jgi:hypothetical protein
MVPSALIAEFIYLGIYEDSHEVVGDTSEATSYTATVS